ncbi:AAEL013779-PA [Aedes aegypti]|uniref:AAEL013779-PA n=1 Tax=Aedes aegypti TaxID=7159 RepID=Q16I69_AEDAE|nr:AAEL013779-PA [Aedes aegypti]
MMPKFIILMVICATAGVFGQRENSLQVIETMRELQPLYKQLQDHIVNQLSEAKLNSSSLVYQLHSDVIETKENFVVAAIDEERQVHDIISHQPSTVNAMCLNFIRMSAEVNVNIAGVSFTNCMVQVDNSFNETLGQFYDLLQAGETLHSVSALFDVFEGENIFHDPDSIVEKLNARMEELVKDPEFIATELLDHVEEFEKELDELKEHYKVCLDEGVKLLVTALDLARTQVVQVCLGQLTAPEGSGEGNQQLIMNV